jgi:hypothetical protein
MHHVSVRNTVGIFEGFEGNTQTGLNKHMPQKHLKQYNGLQTDIKAK